MPEYRTANASHYPAPDRRNGKATIEKMPHPIKHHEPHAHRMGVWQRIKNALKGAAK